MSRCPDLHGKGALAIPLKIFLKYDTELERKTAAGPLTLVFPAIFWPERFIKDERSTKAEASRPTAKKLAANPNAYRKPNVSLEDKSIRHTKKGEVLKNFDNFAYITRRNVVEITTTCNIGVGEELFADYGEELVGEFEER